jgi:Domain of unknown function (DUF4404)
MPDKPLRETAQLLRQAEHLTPEQRQALADAANRLADALNETSPQEAVQLSAAATALMAALHRQDAPVEEHRSRLEEAILAAETRAPVATGLARQLIDALANLGI